MNVPTTHSSFASGKTDRTCKTNRLSNAAFLLTLFGEILDHIRPIFVSFYGNPGTVSGSAWVGSAISACGMSFSPDANNYFSLAVFQTDAQGEFRRRKSQFHALHAIMLDDIGEKVPVDRLTLSPTWLLETSPGNYQAGYLLNEPLIDGVLADQLMNAVVAAGLCDPGANGPRTRLARLPVAVNGKHTPPFQCRLVSWSPDVRYSVGELVDGLQLELVQSARQSRHPIDRPKIPRPDDGDAVWIPGPDENAVLTELHRKGRYKTPLGDGKHDITCPWIAEHTNEIDGGTAYFEPGDSWPIGGFKCLHGHCADRHIRDLLTFLGVEIGAARMKPRIRVLPGEIHRVVDAAERELARAKRYYQRGGLIVTVATDPGTRETRIQEVSQPALVRALSGSAVWERFDGRSHDWVRIDPPARHATVLFDSSSYPHLPVLNGIARQPYLRPDGSLMTASGYDAVTGTFGVFDLGEFSIPENPTRQDAELALDVLNDLLAEFSFKDPQDRSAALSAILTAAVRPGLSLAPMFHVTAHIVGSGKSYLCELITAFASPQRSTPTSFPADNEECRKLLLAELLRSPAVIEFDNLTGDLVAHKSLCMVLTSEYMTGRILGISKTASVSTRTLFLSSGNNVGPVQDMTRRCISIRLSPQCEVPAARTFNRPDLVRVVLRDRGRYISAALTIVRAWIVSGRRVTPCNALASYTDWSDLCRQPLMWLGCADPAASVFESMVEDPDRETVGRLLDAWLKVFGKAPAMVRDAVNRSSGYPDGSDELREVLHDIADERGEINRRRLGWWIKRHSGRIVNGHRFVKVSGNRSADTWRVELVSPVLPVLDQSVVGTVKDE